jgi:hypothetical protein
VPAYALLADEGFVRLVEQDVGTPPVLEIVEPREFFERSASINQTSYEAPENTLFTLAERAEISNRLREIRTSLKENLALTTDQVSHIEERLDEAEEASQRLGQKDWLLLFSGTIFTLIIAGTVTPDVAQHILTMALHGLGHLFLGGIKPLPGPHR